MKVQLKKPVVNYIARPKATKRPAVEMYKRDIISKDTGARMTLVVDYYTPRRRQAGWYLALRKLNAQRQAPQYILFLGGTPELPPSMYTIEVVLKDMFGENNTGGEK